ncbi:hypothetical protein BGY98DRAFT_1174910 [Russula aff. rugulosa BPL654]|nr:hypothetical protein BGY98DRAFT_1174910 [Russula aff. rugulosa BPL654]
MTLYQQDVPPGAIWLARDLRPLPNHDRGDSELNHILHQIRVAVPKRGLLAKPSPSLAHSTTTYREATIQAYTSQELPTLSRGRLSRRRHHEGSHHQQSPRIKNFNPTYTNEFRSSEQPTAQSPLNQVCKLQTSDASLSPCGMGVVQQTLHELHAWHSRKADRVIASGGIIVFAPFIGTM